MTSVYLSKEERKILRNAMLQDLHCILEVYKDVNDVPIYGSEGNDAAHKSNALYAKIQIEKTPSTVSEWLKVFLREDEKEKKFVFPLTKKVWEELSVKSLA